MFFLTSVLCKPIIILKPILDGKCEISCHKVVVSIKMQVISLLINHFLRCPVMNGHSTVSKKGTIINCAAGSGFLCYMLWTIFLIKMLIQYCLFSYLRKHKELSEFVGNCPLFVIRYSLLDNQMFSVQHRILPSIIYIQHFYFASKPNSVFFFATQEPSCG